MCTCPIKSGSRGANAVGAAPANVTSAECTQMCIVGERIQGLK